ncbi:aminotransferase class I/II-fold pyridoxal phosphate-dependent enzyme, partial [bacterium]|nr:aminotransferase class I/II-fold pyridoxal phosphate-dependent enzyme [bacterium]
VLPYHLDAFKQRAGVLALKYLGDMESRVRDIIEGRNAIESCFAGLQVDTWPSGANFVLFRPREITGVTGKALWQKLLDRGILVRDCSSWEGLANCLRVTIGTSQENEAFISAMKEIMK